MASSDEAALDPAELEALAARAGATLEGDREGRGLRVGVACSRFNGLITTRLLDGLPRRARRARRRRRRT